MDASACCVRLFDSGHFDAGRDIRMEGPAESGDLSDLPGAEGKDWNDEADPPIHGAGTTVTLWTAAGFKGDKLVLDAADDEQQVNDDSRPDREQPSSLKVACADA